MSAPTPITAKIVRALLDGSIDSATPEQIRQAFEHLAMQTQALEQRVFWAEINQTIANGLSERHANAVAGIKAKARRSGENRNSEQWAAELERHKAVHDLQQSRKARGLSTPLTAAMAHGRVVRPDRSLWSAEAIADSIEVLACADAIHPHAGPLSEDPQVPTFAGLVRKAMRHAGTPCPWRDSVITRALRYIAHQSKAHRVHLLR
jgi:hypothetical protein